MESFVDLPVQVFQTASERVESAGLAAVGTLTACLSRSVLNSDSEDSLNVFLELVLKGTTSNFLVLGTSGVCLLSLCSGVWGQYSGNV